jgi:hypothetical protein
LNHFKGPIGLVPVQQIRSIIYGFADSFNSSLLFPFFVDLLKKLDKPRVGTVLTCSRLGKLDRLAEVFL